MELDKCDLDVARSALGRLSFIEAMQDPKATEALWRATLFYLEDDRRVPELEAMVAPVRRAVLAARRPPRKRRAKK